MSFRHYRFRDREAANEDNAYQTAGLTESPTEFRRAHSISLQETVLLLKDSADRLDAFLANKNVAENLSESETPVTT